MSTESTTDATVSSYGVHFEYTRTKTSVSTDDLGARVWLTCHFCGKTRQWMYHDAAYYSCEDCKGLGQELVRVDQINEMWEEQALRDLKLAREMMEE